MHTYLFLKRLLCAVVSIPLTQNNFREFISVINLGNAQKIDFIIVWGGGVGA